MKKVLNVHSVSARKNPSSIRLLFLADTHLGFDWPRRARVERRRRGEDFMSNFHRALETARQRAVDLVIHGGDLFHRSRPRQEIVFSAFEPLREIAETGIPVLVVPGNHERSEIPYPLLTLHPRIHIFRKPESLLVKKESLTLEIGGFPQVRNSIRREFPSLLGALGFATRTGIPRLLCMHQSVEGATVGSEYIFRRGEDIIAADQIPRNLLAVLSGHIHRAQILIRSLRGDPLGCPVLYPGSIERTSFAERNEEKGFLTLEVRYEKGLAPRLANLEFSPLPCRPMRIVKLSSQPEWRQALQEELAGCPDDSVVQIRLEGPPEKFEGLTAAALRHLAPPTMTVSLRFPRAPL